MADERDKVDGPMDEATETRRRYVENVCVDANLHGEPREVTSPSGRHRLTIRTYRTGPHSWGYSRGTVVRIADGTLVCDIKRNFIVFHHSFVTKDDHEFLITGRSYMSQTIVDLDRGEEYEPKGDHYNGGAFCWASSTVSSDGKTLAVDGCFWGGPYEFRFFDFTDPARGWAPLPIVGIEGVELPSDTCGPRWLDARTIECAHTEHDSVPQERTRLERRGDEMVVVDHWLSETEQARRTEEARLEAEIDAWWATFHTTDPMYLRLVELLRLHTIPSEYLLPPGSRHIRQCYRRITPHAWADLDWDLDAGTLAICLYTADGSRERELSFPHTVAGIEAAIEVIAERFRKPPTTGE